MKGQVSFLAAVALATLGLVLEVAVTSVAYVTLVLLPFLLVGCPRHECLVHDTRCAGQTVELCSAGGEWTPIANCAEAGAVCEAARGDVNGRHVEGHTCVPGEAR